MRICFGDILQKVINFITFGFGKKLAEKIANALGFEDCGCSRRQHKLNEWGGCKKNIKLF